MRNQNRRLLLRLRFYSERERVPPAVLLSILALCIRPIKSWTLRLAIRETDSYIACHTAMESGDMPAAVARAIEVWILTVKLQDAQEKLQEIISAEIDGFGASPNGATGMQSPTTPGE